MKTNDFGSLLDDNTLSHNVSGPLALPCDVQECSRMTSCFASDNIYLYSSIGRRRRWTAHGRLKINHVALKTN